MMGSVRVMLECKGKSYEVDFGIREDRQLNGQWISEDWEIILDAAVKSVKASAKSAEESN
jgi:hypothetical protein